jgi:uncharacterized protein (TIGR00290 family)
MGAREDILFCWSGGKDSAMALFELQNSRRYRIAALLTTVTEQYDRISMHGVRRALLEQQAESIGLPLRKVLISPACVNDEYETKMRAALADFQKCGVATVAFGDIFLEDLRAYRESNLAKAGMKGLFPIWKQDTRELVLRFLRLGFRAVVVCVDGKALDKSFAGRAIDEQFLRELPGGVDPCGENGEFHSFVFDGPLFRRPVRFSTGEVVLRENFYFCDLLPV